MSLITSTTASGTPTFPGSGDETFGALKHDICAFYGQEDDFSKLELAGRTVRRIIDDLNRKQIWIFNLVTSSPITTVSGQPTIALPSDFWKTYNSRKTDSIDFSLGSMRQSDFDMRFQSQANITGYPYAFVIKNTFRDGTVQLFPTPGAAYTISIRYFKLISKPSADTDLLDLPRPFQTVPYYGALSQMGILNSDADQANYWKTMFDQAYFEMKTSDEDMGDEALRFMNIEEGNQYSYLSPNSRPRAYDFF